MSLKTSCVVAVALSLLTAADAPAQTTPAVPESLKATPGSLKALLLDLSVRSLSVVPGPLSPGLLEIVTSFGELIGLEVSTAPRGTSTGGLTYVYDPSLGTWKQATKSLGPMFAERSLTTGKRKFGAGLNWVHATYNSYDGQDMTNGELRTGTNGTSPIFPVKYTSAKMNLTSNTVEAFVVAGVTNDLDVGIAVPWIRVSLDADLGLFDASGTDLTNQLLGRHFTIPQVSASGVGDISIFGKYNFWHRAEGGLAGQVVVQLPTGDPDNLRSVGVTRTLLSAIWSQGGRVSPHANVGYEFWSTDVAIAPSRNVFAKNQVKYAFGVEFEAHPRVTAVLDIVGRRQLNGGQVGYVTFAAPGGLGTVDGLVGLSEGLNVVSLAPGIKWNAWRNVLVTGNVLASLANNGIRANVVPVIGLDVTF
jgi:hypothetical protein